MEKKEEGFVWLTVDAVDVYEISVGGVPTFAVEGDFCPWGDFGGVDGLEMSAGEPPWSAERAESSSLRGGEPGGVYVYRWFCDGHVLYIREQRKADSIVGMGTAGREMSIIAGFS